MIDTKTKSLIFIVLGLFLSLNIMAQSNIWVGSWSCAPYAAGLSNMPPSPYLENNTLRQVVRVSIGGDALRFKFSNKTSSTAVTMQKVNIALSTGGSTIDESTITPLTFNGNESVTMQAYSSAVSDVFSFPLTPSMHVAITIYYGQANTSSDMTSHVASRTDSYILSGDQSTSVDFAGSTITAHWFHINTIEVQAPDTAGCVAIIGNSITDGYGLSGGLQNRWPDIFSEQLLENEETQNVGVLNLGIGATMVSGTGPTTGISRFKEDVLNQFGVRWAIIFYGVNDIGAGVQANTIIDAYQQMINDAHARNIKVYGATITPFKGNGYYSESNEAVRQTVNEWIRTPGNFDACIDFDLAIRDPEDTLQLLPQYSNDWLHPNTEGYAFLGQSVDLNLFTEIEENNLLLADAGTDQTILDFNNVGSSLVNLDGSGSFDFGYDIASFTWFIGDSIIASGKKPEITLSVGSYNVVLMVSDIEENTAKDSVNIEIINDSGLWIEAECGNVGALWEYESDEKASNGYYVTISSGNNSADNAPTDTSGLINYSFNIEESGNYAVYARLICANANDDSFWLKMNDGNYVAWNNISAPAWQWVKFSETYELAAGENTLTIGYREDGAKLDKLWITTFDATIDDFGADAESCEITSMQQPSILDFNVYPNPIQNELKVVIPNAQGEIKIYSIDNQLLHSQKIIKRETSVNMKSYQSGIYIVKVNQGNKYLTKKVIKE